MTKATLLKMHAIQKGKRNNRDQQKIERTLRLQYQCDDKGEKLREDG